MSIRLLAAGALAALAVTAAPAAAQAPLRPGISPNSRPAFSPYLNLARGGTSAAVNYYGIVRPEIAFRNSILGLQSDVDSNRQLITGGQGGPGQTGLPTTGHGSMFLNTGGYFLNLSGGGGTSRGVAPGAAGGGLAGGVAGRATPPARGRGGVAR